MNVPQWWVVSVNNRLSTGIIYWFILLLWKHGQKGRPKRAVRMVVCLAFLCLSSLSIRFLIETRISSIEAESIGYLGHTLIMAALYFLCFRFCCETTLNEAVFCSVIAFIVFKLAWYVDKTISIYGLLKGFWPMAIGSPAMMFFSYGVYGAAVLLCYAVDRTVIKQPCTIPLKFLLISGLSMAIGLIFPEWCENILEDGRNARFLFRLVTVVYCIVAYALLLLMHREQSIKSDYDSLQRYINDRGRYYRMSAEGVRSLQMKCHDLKHQIALVRSEVGKARFDRYLDDLETTIQEYSTVVHTGNDCIDTILTEKNILCRSNEIRFTYIIDGSLFDFLPELDLYALFGNALDNAIESVRKLPDKEKRIISLRTVCSNGSVLLHLENYFEGELKQKNGLPVTTKKNPKEHGFGIRSIMMLAEKHGGSASFSAEDHVFSLDVLLPCVQGRTECR